MAVYYAELIGKGRMRTSGRLDHQNVHLQPNSIVLYLHPTTFHFGAEPWYPFGWSGMEGGWYQITSSSSFIALLLCGRDDEGQEVKNRDLSLIIEVFPTVCMTSSHLVPVYYDNREGGGMCAQAELKEGIKDDHFITSLEFHVGEILQCPDDQMYKFKNKNECSKIDEMGCWSESSKTFHHRHLKRSLRETFACSIIKCKFDQSSILRHKWTSRLLPRMFIRKTNPICLSHLYSS